VGNLGAGKFGKVLAKSMDRISRDDAWKPADEKRFGKDSVESVDGD